MKINKKGYLFNIGIAIISSTVLFGSIHVMGSNYLNDKLADVSVKIINAKVDLENVKPQVKDTESLVDNQQDKMAEIGQLIAEIQNKNINDINFDMESSEFKQRESDYAKYTTHNNMMWVLSVAPAKWSYLPALDDGGKKFGMWLLEVDNIILAYAVADYDTNSNKFTDIFIQQTQDCVNSTPITGVSLEEAREYYRKNGARW